LAIGDHPSRQQARRAIRRPFAMATGGFVDKEMAPGAILFLAAVLAVLFANSSLSALYESLLSTPMTLRIGAFAIDKPVLFWINDGLMAVFFFLVGLEIKREIAQGELSSWRTASLPLFAALGGMLVPSLVYLAINGGSPDTLRGWAIPAATDIAFALGVLALLGARVPVALKVFLLALAILDDLGAIVIIAVFYTADLSFASLALAGVGAAVLFGMNRLGVTRPAIYIVVGVVVWAAVLKSGVHATLAGVLVALTVPLHTQGQKPPPLLSLEHGLKPWVAYLIMPVFAFANAGVALGGLSVADLLAPVPLGVALGLFIGKQAGVAGFAWLGVRLGLCRLPSGASWRQMYGLALLAGVGFTMSLFIGTLAFSDAETTNGVRLGVLCGSILSAIAGYIVLQRALPAPRRAPGRRFLTHRPGQAPSNAVSVEEAGR
jgi:NhaA family Na+:H+ antiporter